MKLLLTIALLLVASASMAQSMKVDSTIKLSGNYTLSGANKYFTNPNTVYFGQNTWLKIKLLPSIDKTDSAMLYVDKKRVKWINDSTAVIYKISPVKQPK